MLSIDEAIEKNRKIAETKKTLYDACILEEYNRHLLREYKEHDQLAEWLEELKFLKQWKLGIMDSFCKYDASSFEELIANARNKAIDDFVKEICKMIVQSENNGNYRFYAVEIKQAIADLAERLKAGATND